MYLCLTAQTTVEFYLNSMQHIRGNPFDLGSWRKNLASALGEPSWKWLLPIGGPPRPGNGVNVTMKIDSV